MSGVQLGVVRQVIGSTVTVELENVPGYQVGPLSFAQMPTDPVEGDTVIVAELTLPGEFVVLGKLATS